MRPRSSAAALLLASALALGPSPAATRPAVPLGHLVQLAAAQGRVRVIVGLDLGSDVAPLTGDLMPRRRALARAQDQLLADLGRRALAVTRFDYVPGLALEADAETLEVLAIHPLVAYIAEDRALTPSLVDSTSLVGAPALWAGGTTGAGQTVAILDTGVDRSHPFLGGRVVSEACYSTNSMSRFGLCFSGSSGPGSAAPCQSSGACDHGTQVAGIVAGDSASFKGIAPEANIIAIKVYVQEKVTARLLALPSDVIKGLERVYELRGTYNIAAVNLSMNTIPPGPTFSGYNDHCSDWEGLGAAIDLLASAGIATIVPSGNNDSGDGVAWPACLPGAVSVGSTTDGGPDASGVDTVSPFSNSAPILDLLAPGEWIVSSAVNHAFRRNAGTSLAAAHVAGAWALLKARQPGANVTRVLDAFRSTGTPVLDPRNGVVTPRINVTAAAAALGPGCAFTLTPSVVQVGSGAAWGQLRIETAGHCEWLVSGASPSLTFAPRTRGIAPALLEFAVTANPTTSARTSSASIGGQTFTVVQEPCSFTVSPLRPTVGNLATLGEVTVQTQSHCPWTAVGFSGHAITFLDGSSRVGTGRVTYRLTTNSAAWPRHANATIAGLAFSAEQAAAPALRLAPNLNNDRWVDLLWQNRQEGWIAAWMMGRYTMSASELLSPGRVGDTDWRIAAAADMNADGRLDLVWQDDAEGWVAIWMMDGLAMVDSLSTSVPQVADTRWKIVAAQDFNADQKPDLVWHHQVDGYVAVWYMDGVNVLSSELFSPGRVHDTNWKVEAAADFNSDGRTDLVWRHEVTGVVSVWLLDGRTLVEVRDLSAPLVSDSWRIAAIGDLNEDNCPDLVWQDNVEGRIVAWLMNGTTLLQIAEISPARVPDVNWRIVGPK